MKVEDLRSQSPSNTVQMLFREPVQCDCIILICRICFSVIRYISDQVLTVRDVPNFQDNDDQGDVGGSSLA